MDLPTHIPFLEWLGVELLRIGEGEAELLLTLKEQHNNSFAVAHGGVSMTLLDAAMAHAARSIYLDRPQGAPGIVTVEMKTSFTRPGEGRLRALGSLIHHTATLAFCEASLLDDKGELCAHATGTFKYLRALPSGARRVRPLRRGIQGQGSD